VGAMNIYKNLYLELSIFINIKVKIIVEKTKPNFGKIYTNKAVVIIVENKRIVDWLKNLLSSLENSVFLSFL